jgi:hypothetical protein
VADDWCCKGTDPSCDGPQECANRAALLIEAQQAEIKRLRRWKAEAIEVLSRWDAVADMVPVRLGDLKSDAVAAEIERLRAEREPVLALPDDSELILCISQDYAAGYRDGYREATRQIKSLFHPKEARRG